MREENEKTKQNKTKQNKTKQNKTKQTNKQTNKQANKKNFCNNNKMKWHEYLTMDQKPKKVAPLQIINRR